MAFEHLKKLGKSELLICVSSSGGTERTNSIAAITFFFFFRRFQSEARSESAGLERECGSYIQRGSSSFLSPRYQTAFFWNGRNKYEPRISTNLTPLHSWLITLTCFLNVLAYYLHIHTSKHRDRFSDHCSESQRIVKKNNNNMHHKTLVPIAVASIPLAG